MKETFIIVIIILLSAILYLICGVLIYKFFDNKQTKKFNNDYEQLLKRKKGKLTHGTTEKYK